MLRQLLLYVVLIAAIAGFVFLRRPSRAAVGEAPAARVPTLRERIAERDAQVHRLNPDARFLSAVGSIERIVTGRAGAPAACAFEGGGWTIRSGARTVGRVSEFPDFAELHGLLVDWARTLGAAESLAVADLDLSPGTAESRRRGHAAIEGVLGALHAVQAADLADRMWAAGHRDPSTARLGARALAWIAAQCFDQAGAGEVVACRALAWNAVATACDSTATRREAALLAQVLGYPAGGVAAAAPLEASDPIRLAALRRDDVLEAIASRGVSTGGARVREARWLALRRAVERRDLEAWSIAAERGLDADPVLALPLLSGQLALGRFETEVATGTRLLAAVASDLQLNHVASAPIAEIDERTLAQGMELFETLLAAMPEAADGAFLDREVLRGWYRGAFYSSLFAIGEHLRRRLASVEATREFAASLGDGSDGPETSREFARWYSNLAAYKVDARHRGAMREDLGGMEHFGGGPRFHTWEAIHERTSWADPFRRDCARHLEPRLDTRPEHLDRWGRIVMFDLYDLARGEQLMGAAVAASHPGDLGDRGWWAAYRGDRAALDRMLANPNHRPEEVTALVSAIRSMLPADSLRLDAVSERLVGERPDDWSIVGPYVRELESRHRSERVRELCAAWLTRPDRSTRAFDDIDARRRMARACLEEGRVEEGYQAIHSVIGSWQQGAMVLGAELLERRGEGAEAETLAMMAWQRYPDTDLGQALVVDLFWRHGKHDLAADMLSKAEVPLSTRGWQFELGPRFARFRRERPKEAARAVDAMIAAGLGDWRRLGLLVPALKQAGRSAEAVELVQKLAAPGRFDAEVAVATYGHMKQVLGTEAALEGLRRQPPAGDPRQTGLLHLYAYRDDHGEALWQLPIPEGAPGQAEFLWLLRAAAAVRDSIGTPAEREQLRTFYSVPSPEPYRHFGRMLLGLEPVDSVLALRLDRQGEAEACYYIALHLQGAGDVGAAAEWYTRCVAVEMRNNGEHHWAMQQLFEWVTRQRSIDRLSRETRGRSAGRDVVAQAL